MHREALEQCLLGLATKLKKKKKKKRVFSLSEVIGPMEGYTTLEKSLSRQV